MDSPRHRPSNASSTAIRELRRFKNAVTEEPVFDEAPVGFESAQEFLLEESIAFPNVDEFIPKKQIDPWRRLSALEHDCILVVEFSELEGPKPAMCIPESPGAHFERNDFSVWLMTADYQASNHRNGPFFINDDIQMLLTNEEQGVHTYAHHFTLFDIEARGYVRPFCATYVTPDPVKLSLLFETLRAEFTKVLKLVKLCNRRLFRKALTEAAEALNVIETQAIGSYYGLYYDERVDTDGGNTKGMQEGDLLSPSHSKREKPDVLNMRYRRLQRELILAEHAVADDLRSRLCRPSTSIGGCGIHSVSMDQWINSLRRGEGLENHKKTLKDLQELCPCVSGELQRQLRSLWMKYRHWNVNAPWLLEAKTDYGAKVNMGSIPILYLPPEITQREDANNGRKRFDRDQINDFSISEVDALHNLLRGRQHKRHSASSSECGDEDKLLVNISGHLRNLLYPILTGQLLIAYGGDLRRELIISLIQKLKSFIPTIFSSPPCTVWNDDNGGTIPESTFTDYRLVGLRVTPKENINDFVNENYKRYVALLDLNKDIFHVAEYKGDILDRLTTRASSHKSDWTLSVFVLSVLSEYALLAYVFHYCSTASVTAVESTVTTNKWSFRTKLATSQSKDITSQLNLHKGDAKIVRYIVELLKLQHGDRENKVMDERDDDALFLDYEPAQWHKM